MQPRVCGGDREVCINASATGVPTPGRHLDQGDAATVVLIAAGVTGAKEACRDEVEFTGAWSATATADQPNAIPATHDTADAVPITIGGDTG